MKNFTIVEYIVLLAFICVIILVPVSAIKISKYGVKPFFERVWYGSEGRSK